MMYSGKKFLLFSLLGILLGYLFHRLTLLYDSYTGNSLDKWTHLLMEGQDEVLQSPWNVSFTGKSSAFFSTRFCDDVAGLSLSERLVKNNTEKG